MTLQALDVVVLTRDLPADGLCRGDLGAVVEVYRRDSLGVRATDRIGVSARTR